MLGETAVSTLFTILNSQFIIDYSPSPFGEYRIDPPDPADDITDRGFTGHKHNDDIELIYMNARYYVPAIGRFASADTIVPNPGNPQSYNRYSYVRNNPLNLIDPSGHRECGDSEDCIDPLTHEPDSSLIPSNLVEFDGGNWTPEEMETVRAGAWRVAVALYLASGDQFSSPQEAFLSVYGGAVKFSKTGTSAGNLGKWDRDQETGQHIIYVNEQTDGAKITGYKQGTMWVAHELGHAFNASLSPNQTEPDSSYGQGLIDLAQEGVWVGEDRISGATNSESWLGDYERELNKGYKSDTGPHIQNPQGVPASEDFADMFSNWVHRSFTSDDFGQARYNFMQDHMSNWINLAVTNNE
jgi:RHS repeat-associated protein